MIHAHDRAFHRDGKVFAAMPAAFLDINVHVWNDDLICLGIDDISAHENDLSLRSRR